MCIGIPRKHWDFNKNNGILRALEIQRKFQKKKIFAFEPFGQCDNSHFHEGFVTVKSTEKF